MERRSCIGNALAYIAVALEVRHWAQAETGVSIEKVAWVWEPVQTRESLCCSLEYSTVGKKLARTDDFDRIGQQVDAKETHHG